MMMPRPGGQGGKGELGDQECGFLAWRETERTTGGVILCNAVGSWFGWLQRGGQNWIQGAIFGRLASPGCTVRHHIALGGHAAPGGRPRLTAVLELRAARAAEDLLHVQHAHVGEATLLGVVHLGLAVGCVRMCRLGQTWVLAATASRRPGCGWRRAANQPIISMPVHRPALTLPTVSFPHPTPPCLVR